MSRDRRVEIEERLAALEGRLAQPESEAAGELAHVDQHPGDTASELYDREQDVQRIDALRAELRALDDAAAHPGAPPVPRGERLAGDPDGDDRTPMDVVEPDPPDLAAIPMGPEDTIDLDAQDLDAPGELYREGSQQPDVGDPDGVGFDEDRRYRPDE